MSAPPPQPPKDYRPNFTSDLNDPAKMKNANGVTKCVVGKMNDKMSADGVPMAKAHYQAATKSVQSGAPLCGFLAAENQHVLDSSGSGMVYHAGKMFHAGLRGMAEKPGAGDWDQ